MVAALTSKASTFCVLKAWQLEALDLLRFQRMPSSCAINLMSVCCQKQLSQKKGAVRVEDKFTVRPSGTLAGNVSKHT